MKMFLFLRIFLIFIALYHILNTIFVFGIFGGHFQTFFSFSKDLLWILFFILLVLSNIKFFLQHLKKTWLLYILFFLLIWRSSFISFSNGKEIFDIVVWFKYWIYFFFIVISSVFLWALISQKNSDKRLKDFYIFLFNTLFFIIIFSLFWQILKFVIPWFFQKLGYWPVWDYINWQNPPIYYRTWKWWVPRLAGIFSWPNNYGFFFVSYFSFFAINIFKPKINSFSNNISQIRKFIIYVLSVIFTISRGAILWVWIQIIFISKQFWSKINKKIFYLIVWVILIWIISLTIWKWPSSLIHLQSTQKAFEFFLSNPMGYGLGTSWPAVHFHWTILPENVFLQILIDTGIIWFFLWIWIFAVLYIFLFKIYKKIKDKENAYIVYLKYLFFGLTWLLVEWFFLHVFEDSMVNYLFFIPFGILIGYLLFRNDL